MKLLRLLSAHRTYLGVQLGLAAWAFFRGLTGGFNILSPVVCMLVTMWTAGAYEPGKMAKLGIAVGFLVGVFTSVQDAVWNSLTASGPIDLWLDWVLQFPLTTLSMTVYFAVAGLACGSVAQLYNRRAIF